MEQLLSKNDPAVDILRNYTGTPSGLQFSLRMGGALGYPFDIRPLQRAFANAPVSDAPQTFLRMAPGKFYENTADHRGLTSVSASERGLAQVREGLEDVGHVDDFRKVLISVPPGQPMLDLSLPELNPHFANQDERLLPPGRFQPLPSETDLRSAFEGPAYGWKAGQAPALPPPWPDGVPRLSKRARDVVGDYVNDLSMDHDLDTPRGKFLTDVYNRLDADELLPFEYKNLVKGVPSWNFPDDVWEELNAITR